MVKRNKGKNFASMKYDVNNVSGKKECSTKVRRPV